MTDRVGDAVLMGGVAYYLTAHHHGQLVLLPFAILTHTFLISYERSKAESLGLAAKGGLMERAERLILLGRGPRRYAVFIPVLWVMLGLTAMTALGRFWRVWQVAARPAPAIAPAPAHAQHTRTAAPGTQSRVAPLDGGQLGARRRASRRSVRSPMDCSRARRRGRGARLSPRPSVDATHRRARHLADNLRHALAPAGRVRARAALLEEFVDRGFRSYGHYWAEGAKLPAIPTSADGDALRHRRRPRAPRRPRRSAAGASSSRCPTSGRGSGAARTWTRSASR